MRYIFFGTPEFAAIILEKLARYGFTPSALVCNPDRPVGRKQIVTPPPAKQAVLRGQWATEVLQPETLDTDFAQKITSLKADFFVVASYAKILREDILRIPHLGAIGVHPSLLPKYRGTTPVQTAILNGEQETGVTLYLLDAKVDNGLILAQKACGIEENDTYETLLKKLAGIGGKLLLATLPQFSSGSLKPQPQDDARATFTKKFKSEDGLVMWQSLLRAQENGDGAPDIERKIRALNPEPGVYTVNEAGKRIKLLGAELSPSGTLLLKIIQEEGKRPVSL